MASGVSVERTALQSGIGVCKTCIHTCCNCNYIFIYSHTILPSSSVPQDKDPALTLHKPELSSLYLPSPVEDTDDTV